MRDRAADIDDHRHDALRDEARTVAAHRDRHSVAGEQPVRRIAVGPIGQRRAHDGAALDEREQRIDRDRAFRIEALVHCAGGRVIADRRHQAQRFGAGLRAGFKRRADFLEQPGQGLAAIRLRRADPYAFGARARRGRLRRYDRFHLGIVVVKAAPGLAAQHPGLIACLHDQVRPVARLLEKLVVDQHGGRLGDVEAGELHQLERPHAEAADIAHHAVDVNEIGDALVHQVRGFEREAAADLIDEKTGRIGAAHRLARHALADCDQRLTHPFLGLQPGDHFDQPHQRHGIEEMKTGKALGRLEPGGDRGHRQ